MTRRLLVAVLVALAAAPLLASLAGFGLVVFTSDSMAPAIRSGSVALVRSVPLDELAAGDVVSVVSADGSRVTHRLVAAPATGDTGLQLRGDANPAADRELHPVGDRVDRVALATPRVGAVVRPLAEHRGAVLAVAVLACIALAVQRCPGPRTTAPVARTRAPRASVACAVVAVCAVASSAVATRAYFTDVATLQSGSFQSRTVAATVIECGPASSGQVEITWQPVAGATGYTVLHDGGSATVAAGASSYVITDTANVAEVRVVVLQAFASVTWTSVPSNALTYTVGALSACE